MADAELSLELSDADPLARPNGAGNNGPSQALGNAVDHRFGNRPRLLNLCRSWSANPSTKSAGRLGTAYYLINVRSQPYLDSSYRI